MYNLQKPIIPFQAFEIIFSLSRCSIIYVFFFVQECPMLIPLCPCRVSSIMSPDSFFYISRNPDIPSAIFGLYNVDAERLMSVEHTLV